MRRIHADRGLDHDRKYSSWRREIFPRKARRTDAYCTDIDWVEWRQGKPVALLECRRAIGSISTAEDAVLHIRNLNRGFQFEVLARLSYSLGIPAYIVGIQDPSPDSKDYSESRFVVGKVIPPNPWPLGRIDIDLIKVELLPPMNEDKYIQFLSGLV